MDLHDQKWRQCTVHVLCNSNLTYQITTLMSTLLALLLSSDTSLFDANKFSKWWVYFYFTIFTFKIENFYLLIAVSDAKFGHDEHPQFEMDIWRESRLVHVFPSICVIPHASQSKAQELSHNVAVVMFCPDKMIHFLFWTADPFIPYYCLWVLARLCVY